MKKNMAILDRFLRLTAAIVLLIYTFTSTVSLPWNIVLAVVAVIFIVTAFAGSCPLYRLLGIDTRQFKDSDFAAKR